MGGQSERTHCQAKMAALTQSSTYEPGLATISYLSRIVVQPPTSSLCCPRGHLHTIHIAKPRSPSYPPSTYILHQHSSSDTLLIHSLQLPKPSQYSLIRSTRQLPFYASSHTHLLSPNSVNSWHSNQTSQTLHLKNIHFPSLSTSHTQCLCSVERRWYNYPFI